MIQTDVIVDKILSPSERLLKLGLYECIVLGPEDNMGTWKTNITRTKKKLREIGDERVFRFKNTKEYGQVIVRTV